MRTLGIAVLFSVSSTIAACGGTPKPVAESPKPEPTAAASVSAPSKDTVPNSPTASAIKIDDAILSKCGIPAPEAYFAFDSSKLQDTDSTPLTKVASCFGKGPLKGRQLKLIGHADPRGDSDYNFMLGQARADSVAHFLLLQGMPKSNEQTTSRGALDARGSDEATWAHDRRVDLMLGD
jgi:peptidoglycan-associated lipoprotein